MPLPSANGTPDPRFQAPQSYTPRHLAEKILTSRAALAGERKQVTVLFCDLPNSTPLAERLGPEAMHTLLNRFFELALGEVHRYEGTINQFLGDGFMALFGAPIAHEEHARRAVLAAVGLQRHLHAGPAVLGQSPGVDVAVRIGLNTGLVIVGAIGDNLRMDYTAVGDTTNVAARLQQATAPGQIIIAETTHRLVAGYCTFARGEAWAKALEYLYKAAEKAAQAFATREAVALYDQALEAAGHLGDAVETGTLMAIHQAKADLYFILSDYERSRAAAERLLGLARRAGADR
jgi:class 3 adenylate cyclase